MSTLLEIFDGKYTDKVQNGIAEVYEQLFAPIRLDVHALLEIGVDRGGSIEAWLEFFPDADIYGIDLRPSGFTHERYTEINDDVKDIRIFDLGGYGLSIVIDDGSHWNTDIIRAFEIFWPLVNPKGYYCIEDIQVPFKSHAYPRTEVFFTNFAKEHGLDYDIPRYNLMWLRKGSN